LNRLELQMVEILKDGISNGSYVGVKAEFEAEGTRMEELLRLLDVARRAEAKMAVKIGGCEAIRDLLESKQIGVDYIIAPMVESAYALRKFDAAISKSYDDEERKHTQFLFNLETRQTFNQVKEIISTAKQSTNVSGVVFGRNDYSGSMGLGSKGIESAEVTNDVLTTANLAKNAELELVVGGGVSSASVGNLKKIKAIHLSRFETRKILFHSDALENKTLERDLLDAVKFELLWLKNKQEHYLTISKEDETRFETLNSRWGLI